MTDMFSLAEAAAELDISDLYLGHIIEVGDVVPAYVKKFEGTIWHEKAAFGFLPTDIEAFRAELHRRRFVDLKAKYPEMIFPGADFACGPGWTDLIEDFLKEVIKWRKFDVAFMLYSLKEKFGSIQISTEYSRNFYSTAERIKQDFKKRSLTVCEECGKPGRLRMGVGICKTTCDRHAHLVGELRDDDGIILEL